MSKISISQVHELVEEFAASLEKRGHVGADIVDALIIRGVNAGIRLAGRDHMAKFLTDTAQQVSHGKEIGETAH